jgi:hypothetical protein
MNPHLVPSGIRIGPPPSRITGSQTRLPRPSADWKARRRDRPWAARARACRGDVPPGMAGRGKRTCQVTIRSRFGCFEPAPSRWEDWARILMKTGQGGGQAGHDWETRPPRSPPKSRCLVLGWELGSVVDLKSSRSTITSIGETPRVLLRAHSMANGERDDAGEDFSQATLRKKTKTSSSGPRGRPNSPPSRKETFEGKSSMRHLARRGTIEPARDAFRSARAPRGGPIQDGPAMDVFFPPPPRRMG